MVELRVLRRLKLGPVWHLDKGAIVGIPDSTADLMVTAGYAEYIETKTEPKKQKIKAEPAEPKSSKDKAQEA